MISVFDVSQHNSRSSCWVIIAGNAYDVTEFIDDHPGGANVILRFAGKDATEEYEPWHPPGTIERHLPKDKHLGQVSGHLDSTTTESPSTWITNAQVSVVSESNGSSPLPLNACQSLDDLEQAGRTMLTARARAYFDSAAETSSTYRQNRNDWSRITFRPRVLRNVAKVSMGCHIMGSDSSMPVFIAPTAALRLGHKDGELCLAQGAARMAIPQCVSTYSSVAPRDVVQCYLNDPHRRGGSAFFQLYMPKEVETAKKLITEAKESQYSALVITIDSAVIGKRDDDDRFKALQDRGNNSETDRLPMFPGREAETLRGVHCSTFEWKDIGWIRESWGNGPIILKGIQTAEDALEATCHGIDGIYLSNHGGRQLDYAPSAVQVLLDIRDSCPEVFDKTEVYVDGGVMRGSDVVKALCLGARAVGIGRGFIYASSAYGVSGVLKALTILSDEIQTTMRLLGVTTLSELNDTYINLSQFGHQKQARAKI